MSSEKFEYRHNSSYADRDEMLKTIGAASMEELLFQTVPDNIRLKQPLKLPPALSEPQLMQHLKSMMQKNKLFTSYIGMGYYNCYTPAVIQRNIVENPGWYTAYTPYQAEVSQGRLEALMNYQTMIADLCGLPIANASLLDEGTAAAEAMAMLFNTRSAAKQKAKTFFVSNDVFPQVKDVLITRAEPLGIKLVMDELSALDVSDESIYGIYLQNPDNTGAVHDYQPLISNAHTKDIQVVMGTDLMSLLLFKPPGEMGADVAVGNAQRFGVPMGFGGPHAGFFATQEHFKRQIPGRIIGQSIDAQHTPAFRMALQTREQHIRREKATSNICTAQVLLAVMAGMYAVYHGPKGLKKMAERIHSLASSLGQAVEKLGVKKVHKNFFDTLYLEVNDTARIKKIAESKEINFRYFSSTHMGISLDETTTEADVERIVSIFSEATQKTATTISWSVAAPEAAVRRQSSALTHPVFSQYHAEHDMLRYLKKLENKDISMVHSMISLGSCTMKLNATSEMLALSWPEVNSIHPFVPSEQTKGYQELISNVEKALLSITGFSGVSLQPNSGAQGEYAGLLTIRAYHKSRNDPRHVTLIPASAHGTNPASAVLAGMKVVVIASDSDGKIDVADLQEKAKQYEKELAALMVTYPSTHGVFEETIVELCDIVHRHGGLVYMDGANMNAQVGITSPAAIGADVCHLNLHKTFAIPHGGGGPGVGPICVTEKLKPFLPGHNVVKTGGAIPAVSSAPWGSASILTISYAYIALMGADGLTHATEMAILNANYMLQRLQGHYDILYVGTKGRCAHEMIVDCRAFKSCGVSVSDIAKRLMDYGFHAPTVSFPVAGTLMVEPTESESKAELDRFCDALIEIRNEIREIENGGDPTNNVLIHAPHTAEVVSADTWDRPYSRRKAAYPLSFVLENKFWPSVSRVDDAHGDRNLICTCS